MKKTLKPNKVKGNFAALIKFLNFFCGKHLSFLKSQRKLEHKKLIAGLESNGNSIDGYRV